VTDPVAGSDTTKRSRLVVAVLTVGSLYQIARPGQVAVEVLNRFPGEFAAPISSTRSWSDSFFPTVDRRTY
jgi:hypothetical protein